MIGLVGKGTIGRDLGKDDSDYVGAARVLQSGHNPYRWQAVWHQKQQMLGLSNDQKGKDLARVAEPPLLIWAMEPLTRLPFPDAAAVLEIIFLLSAAAGMTVLLRAFGWRWGLLALGVLAGMALPPVTDYVYFGNVGIVIFAALGAGVWLARKYPFAAGLFLAVAICKPQVALPLAGLVVLFHSRSRLRALGGFVAGAAAIVAGSALAAGPTSLLWWLHSLHAFTGTLSTQPLLASLAVLYEPYVSSGVAMIIMVALIIPAVLATILALRAYWHDEPLPIRNLAWLWVFWFAVAPYGHYYDYAFLAPVVVSLLACARPGDRVRALVILYAVFLAGPLQTVTPQHAVAPFLLLIVVAASALPWPPSGRRVRPIEELLPADQYAPSA
jgi:hypothetical protein